MAVILLVTSILFLFTFCKQKQERITIPFSLSSGIQGNILLDIPQRVWVGETYRIRSQIEFFASRVDFYQNLIVEKLETSAEFVDPRGEIRISLQTDSPVIVEWKVKTTRNTVYPGMFWFWIEYDDSRELILARDFNLESRFILDLRMMVVRITLGLIVFVSLAGLILSLLQTSGQKKQ